MKIIEQTKEYITNKEKENIFAIDNYNYAKKVKFIMQNENITPSALTTKTKIDKGRIDEILNKNSKPKLEEFILICYALKKEWNIDKILHLIDLDLINVYEEEIKNRMRSKQQ